MKKPRMILFDYGYTLLDELGFDSLRGTEAIMEYVTANPRSLSPAEVNRFTEDLYNNDIVSKAREHGIELHEFNFQHLAYEYQQLEFSISVQEIERIFWDNAAPGERMPNVEEMLAYLRDNGIRTGVISNAMYSGHALRSRIERLLPEHKFEFVIVSSEYMIRKPNPMLFELALRKANLPASDVWFCGDSVLADIEGASDAGIFPVWYTDTEHENPWRAFRPANHSEPACEHLHIHNWLELVELLRNI